MLYQSALLLAIAAGFAIASPINNNVNIPEEKRDEAIPFYPKRDEAIPFYPKRDEDY
ncbi:putative Lysostaphin N-terminal domain-containing protein [Seiridium unicorne]|uniref:Lysostaphin N-terminal domain-containing protein n=1 Tax=Seiridium unicorne TaxID=138068 RepID=A0ABR2UZR2_9PEZI